MSKIEGGVADPYARITGRILEHLEQGVRPWTKPWSAEHLGGASEGRSDRQHRPAPCQGFALSASPRSYESALKRRHAERVGADVHYVSASHAVEDLDHWLFMHRLSPPLAPQPQADSERPAFTSLDLVRFITPALAVRVEGASTNRLRS